MRTAGGRQAKATRRAWVDGFCALALAMFAANCGVAAGEPDLTVRVRVYNYAEVSTGVLEGAEKEASRIFKAAGVDTTWVHCLDPRIQAPSASTSAEPVTKAEPLCDGPVNGSTLMLRVFPRSTQARGTFRESVFGFAYIGGPASVFWERIQDLANSVDGDPNEAPVILGDVIAHELGHLLLETDRHSPTGIMSANWDWQYLRLVLRGRQLFSREQSAVLRATVIRRNQEIVQP